MAKVLVTGSTGNVGSQLVPRLLSRGHSVRAFIKKGDKTNFPAGVEVAEGDFGDKNSLRSALNGVSRMYLLVPGSPDIEQQEANVIDAAKAAGVQLIVKHSVAGAQYKAIDIGRWHRAGEERIEASGIPYVFLRPAPFAANALWWAGSIKGQGAVYGALGDSAQPVVDPGDIAEVAAGVLSNSGHEGKAYDVTGPATLTTEEQVNIIGKVIGKPLKYVNVPDSAAKDSMLGMGMNPRYVDAMVEMIGALRGWGKLPASGDVKKVTGKDPVSFEQWATNNAAAFK
jgi:uncharacterized protein YbjT (DUF2867 family)